MSKKNVIGFGAALVDIQFKIEEAFLKNKEFSKGTMILSSDNEQDELFRELSKNSSSSNSCGGSATNTIYASAALGSNNGFIGKIGKDKNGLIYREDLELCEINTHNCIESPKGVTGSCIVMISEDAERTMSTYLGISSELEISELDLKSIKEYKLIFIESYVVTSPSTAKAAIELIKFCKETNVKIALSLSDPNIVLSFNKEIKKWMNEKIDFLFCNSEEAENFLDSKDLRKFNEFSKCTFVTCGSNSTKIIEINKISEIEAFPSQAIDTNGAGDMFAGGVIHCISLGWSSDKAAKFGNYLASKGVSEYGPRLKKEDYSRYFEEFKNIYH